MTDIDKLIAAVEAGGWDTILSLRALPKLADGRRGSRRLATYGRDACSGSLDAALRLHSALMPRTNQYSIVTDPTCLCVKVAGWPNGLGDDIEIHGEGWDDGNAARAWLLALLRAVKAQGDAA